jgi:hypothetical protein
MQVRNGRRALQAAELHKMHSSRSIYYGDKMNIDELEVWGI